MMPVLSEIAVTLSASTDISIVAKATVVLAFGLIGAWFARRKRAAVRHALLASTFSVLLALPIVSFLATPVPITIPVAKGDSSIWPLLDYVSAPPSRTPSAVPLSAPAAKPGSKPYSLSAIALLILLWGWRLGAALFALQFFRGLLRIRSLRRFGLPWRQGQLLAQSLAPDINRRVEVVLHESLPGPVTCGVLNPLIVLPSDSRNWAEQDLARALIHEMEHVRRNDWAIHCLARVTCAIYWFHPLVWTARRQLTLAAEQSCDDAVLRNSEATAYADQLVALARKRSILRKSPALAMASRSDLAARVSALLDGGQRRGPVGAPLVAAACIAAAAIILTMSPLQMVAVPQGNPKPAMPDIPKWEAVSIKRCPDPPLAGHGAGINQSSNRLTMVCQPLESFAHIAYDLYPTGKKREFWNALTTRFDGFPDWAKSERYMIEAKAEGNPGQLMMGGPMLQALLEDRFQLRVHKETREGKVYILSVEKSGPKMATPPPGGCTTMDYYFRDEDASMTPPPSNPCPYSGDKPPNKAIDGWMNMNTLSILLTRTGGMDAPIVNRTDLTDAYHVQLQWTNQNLSSASQKIDPLSGPSIFTAVQKLGLKIEAGKGPRQFLVFDHAERPSEN